MRSTTALFTARLLIAAVLALVAAPPAVAAPKSEAERQALVYSAQAKSAYAGARYGDAAGLFMKAYGQIPEPTLVYNAARAYQKAGRGKEALPLFRLYISLETHDDEASRAGRAEAQRHIAELQAQHRADAAKSAAERRALEEKAATHEHPPAGTGGSKTSPGAQLPPQNNPPGQPQPTTGPHKRVPAAGFTPTGRKVVHRPDLFSRVSRITKPAVWSPQESRAAMIGGASAVALLLGLTLHLVETDLEAIDASAAGKPLVQGGRTFYPGVTQKQMDAALGSHNAASYIGNTLIIGGLAAGGVATWLWFTAPHGVALRLNPTDGGALVFAQGRF
jgi:hypothetical protein